MVKLKYFLPLSLLLGFAHVAFSISDEDFYASQETLTGCLEAAGVPLVSESDTDYASSVLPFNLRLKFYPAAVVFPTTSVHVSSAVKCAGKFETKVAARSGGHSYASFGLGGVNGSLVIDMKRFRDLSFDPATNIVKVGAGLRLGDVASRLYAIAGRGLPHGLCPGVGISGHALHGGFGLASRMWGTTLDNVVEMEVILASGDIVIVSKKTNPDLFWALRGAGSSFGIVTTFSLTTYPAPPNAIEFTWSWTLDNNATGVVETKVKIFEALQDYAMVAAPSNMALRIITQSNSEFVVTGAYWGSRGDFDAAIAPLAASFPQDNLPAPKIAEHGYLDMLVTLAGAPLPQPENYTQHDTFFTKSIVTPTKLTTKSLTSFFTFHAQNAKKPPLSWFVIVELYGGEHSNISSQNPQDSSYSIRDALFTIQLYSRVNAPTPYPPWGIEMMKGMTESITLAQPETKFHAYPNYVDPTLSPAEAHELYYGDNYPRLKSLKNVYDPNFLIWNPQAIGTL